MSGALLREIPRKSLQPISLAHFREIVANSTWMSTRRKICVRPQRERDERANERTKVAGGESVKDCEKEKKVSQSVSQSDAGTR